MKVGLAQINTVIGDLEGNVGRCAAAVGRATDGGAELVVLPEMAVSGYPPRDILYDSGFVDAVGAATSDLARQVGDGPPVVVGTVVRSGTQTPGHPGLLNAAALTYVAAFLTSVLTLVYWMMRLGLLGGRRSAGLTGIVELLRG